jgi:hypothetical protein
MILLYILAAYFGLGLGTAILVRVFDEKRPMNIIEYLQTMALWPAILLLLMESIYI